MFLILLVMLQMSSSFTVLAEDGISNNSNTHNTVSKQVTNDSKDTGQDKNANESKNTNINQNTVKNSDAVQNKDTVQKKDEVKKKDPVKKQDSNKNENTIQSKLNKIEDVSIRDSKHDTTVVKGAKLTQGTDGMLYYDGQPLVVGINNQTIPSQIQALLEKGVGSALPVVEAREKSLPSDALQKVNSVSLLEKGLNSFKSVFSPINVYAGNAPRMENRGVAVYGGSKTAWFYVDGKLAYCLNASKGTPATGQDYNPVDPYNGSTKLVKAMYYGWGGPGNIFKDKTEGYVITHLVLSEIYSGSYSGGKSLSGYHRLWDKINNSQDINTHFSFTDINLSVSVKNGKQVSQSTTLNADKNNGAKVKVPKDITLVNETTGKTVINGTMEIKGGQRVHLEAPLSKSLNYSTGNLQSTNGVFQPFVTLPRNNSFQELGYWDYYKDPLKVAHFSAKFTKRTVTMTINHKDRQTGEVLKTDKKTVTIGDSYSESNKPYIMYKGIKEIPEKSQTLKGTVPSKNFTLTFWYTTQWKLTVQYIDHYNNKVLQTINGGNYKVNQTYSKTVPNKFTQNGTTYKINGSTTLTGTMPRHDLTVKAYYDPYQHVTVKWKNQYPDYDIFKKVDTMLKVGVNYNYTQPETFTLPNGAIFDRNDNSVFAGTMGYSDLDHTFNYRLRKLVTVNYLDNRTGSKLTNSKNYTVHQGDSYSETPPTISKGQYTYRFVRQSGDSANGVVGTKDIVINYYYDIPLVKVELKKFQIYTAKASEGLPVKIDLGKSVNYPISTPDLKDTSKQISISLYQGSTKIDSKSYTASAIPTNLTFKIPAKGLKVDTNKPYTVKLEGYNPNDFDVPQGKGQLTTDGFTSAEKTVTLNVRSDSDHADSKKYVVMTEVTPTTQEKRYYETIKYSATPLQDQKSGYGVTTNVNLDYTNELGSDYQYATSVPSVKADFYVPSNLMDSNLNYPANGNTVKVPMDKHESTVTGTSFSRTANYQFPHVNVERMTGKLYTDDEVAAHDNRITNSIVDGGHQWYSPIWSKLGTYKVSYKTSQVGANKITIDIEDTWKLYAQMMATMDSDTEKQDEILFMPINGDKPFDGVDVPENFKQSDINWLKY